MSLRDRVTLGTVAVLGARPGDPRRSRSTCCSTDRLSADASSVLANRADALARDARRERRRADGARGARRRRARRARLGLRRRRASAIERSPATDEARRARSRALARVRTPHRASTRPSTCGCSRGPVDGAGVVVVGVSLDPYRHTERLAVVGTLVLDVFVLLAGALVARRAVGAALRPVADMTEQARTGASTTSTGASRSARRATS